MYQRHPPQVAVGVAKSENGSRASLPPRPVGEEAVRSCCSTRLPTHGRPDHGLSPGVSRCRGQIPSRRISGRAGESRQMPTGDQARRSSCLRRSVWRATQARLEVSSAGGSASACRRRLWVEPLRGRERDPSRVANIWLYRRSAWAAVARTGRPRSHAATGAVQIAAEEGCACPGLSPHVSAYAATHIVWSSVVPETPVRCRRRCRDVGRFGSYARFIRR